MPEVMGVVVERVDRTSEPFAAAYARLWPDAVRLAQLLTGSAAAAEDVAQDAFIGLHRRWEVVDNPDGYVRTSVVNGARSHGRRAGRRARALPIDRPADGVPRIDETWALLHELPERQRAALVLRYYEDLPLAEIATILDCRVGTVKSAIHRGLARLREVTP